MRNKYLLTFLLVAFYLFVSIQAFAAKISGVVTDAKDSTTMSGVTVFLKNTDKGTQTDADGYFEIDNVEDGTYEILFSLMTYKKTLQTITVNKGKDVMVNLQMKEDGKNLQEVTVKSTRATSTENAVMMEMRKSSQIVSGISSQQIQKTMDRNAADVVKRVPGVTIMDDKFIMVRGLSDRYNSVWLNDAGAPSSEVDKRSFSFDIIPSGQIDRILVYKTPAPELPGDFAGGMVKIYTTSIPDKNSYTLGIQTSSRQNSTGTQFNYAPKSKTDWLGYDDGGRSIPANTPEVVNKTDDGNNELSKEFAKGWNVQSKTAKPDLRFNLAANNIFVAKKVRIGNTFGISYSNISTNYITQRKDWEGPDPRDFYKDQTSINNVNVALLDNIAAAWGNNKIEFKNLYNQTGRSSLLYRVNDNDSGAQQRDERTYNIGYESRAIFSTQLTGTHKSSDDRRKYTWSLGYSDLFKNQPGLKRVQYTKDPMDSDTMYKAGVANAVSPVYGGGMYYAALSENVYSFSHQFSQQFKIGNYEFEANIGNYIEYKKRNFSSRTLGFTIKPSLEALTITRNPINEIFTDKTTGSNSLFKVDENTLSSDRYDASNQLIASFVSLKLPIGDKVSVYGGVRYEHNTYELKSVLNTNPLEPKVVTKFFLPSVNIAYNITDKQLLRVAYGKTLNRPEFRENSPFYFFDLENRWGLYGAMFQTAANKDGDTLDVAQIQNVDARWEWYPASGEMVQAGVFYKSFKNPIQQVIVAASGDNRSFSFANLDNGYSMGFELDVRKSLVFIDNAFNIDFFKNLSIVGNLALIKSEVTPKPLTGNDTTLSFQKTPFQGQSPYMYNAGLYYQNDPIGLQASLLYNVFGPRIYVLGATYTSVVGNFWDLPFHSMDFTASKTFFKHYSLSFGVQNLLNSTVRQAQDMDKNNKIDKAVGDVNASADRLTLSYKPGRYYTVGIKVRF